MVPSGSFRIEQLYYRSDGEVTQNIECFPSGEVFVENHNKASNNSPYKFNGKELDAETGYYYYGARYYNPRVSLWLNVDPLADEYPDMSPYIYCANNPLRYIDPDGRFLMDVHRRITENALNSSRKGNWKNVSKGVFAFRSAIVGYYAYEMSYKSGSVVAPDLRTLPKILGGKGMESNSREHFDNMNFSQINENFSYIEKNIDKAIGSYNSGAIDSFELGKVVGEYYHAIQDFYSHSNYVELYEKTYGQTNVKNIPTYADAMSNKKYARFAALLKAELKTGEYPGKGPGSHRQMNHDLGAGASYETSLAPEVLGRKVNWNSRAAEDVATRSTRNTNTYVESKIK